MAALLRTIGRQCLLQNHSLLIAKRAAPASSTAYDEMRKFWDTNRKLQRPMSPFLTAYKPHLPMLTSLTHRVTGVVMMVASTGISISLMALPGDFSHYLDMVKGLALGPVIIYSAKLILAFPVTYHFFNGIRHLAWDAGVGFGLQTLYRSAYFVMGITALVTGYFVFVL